LVFALIGRKKVKL